MPDEPQPEAQKMETLAGLRIAAIDPPGEPVQPPISAIDGLRAGSVVVVAGPPAVVDEMIAVG